MSVDSTLFVANARTALKLGLRQSGVRRGSTVLLPEFICDAVLHAVGQACLTPVYYPVTQKLAPKWDVLESLAAGADAGVLVMIHYFGQPQNVPRFRSICSNYRLVLVEDNAHGYGGRLNGELLGSFGDIGISSPRKLLSTPSGGALHGADTSSRKAADHMKRSPVFRGRAMAKLLVGGIPSVRRLVKKLAAGDQDWGDPRRGREGVQPDWRVDLFSNWRIHSTDWPAVAVARRSLWSEWASFARDAGLRPVFADVHPESCPWGMPAFARNLEERNHWLAWGDHIGLPIFSWPALPEEIIRRGGDALALWEQLVCFGLDSSPPRRVHP